MYIFKYVITSAYGYVQINVKTFALMEVNVNRCKDMYVDKSNARNANMQTKVNNG